MSPLSQPGRRQSFKVQFYGQSLILYSPATCGVSTSRPCVQSASHEPTKQSSAVVNMLGNIVFHRLWGLFNAYGRSFQYMIQKNRTEKKKRWWFWFDDVSSIRRKRRVRLHTCYLKKIFFKKNNAWTRAVSRDVGLLPAWHVNMQCIGGSRIGTVGLLYWSLVRPLGVASDLRASYSTPSDPWSQQVFLSLF